MIPNGGCRTRVSLMKATQRNGGKRQLHPCCDLCRRTFAAEGLAPAHYTKRDGSTAHIYACSACYNRNIRIIRPARPKRNKLRVTDSAAAHCALCRERSDHTLLIPVSYGAPTGPTALIVGCDDCVQRNRDLMYPLNLVKSRDACRELAQAAMLLPDGGRCAVCRRWCRAAMLAPCIFSPVARRQALVAACAPCQRRYPSFLRALKGPSRKVASKELQLPQEDAQSGRSRRDGRALPPRVTGIVLGGSPGLGRRS